MSRRLVQALVVATLVLGLTPNFVFGQGGGSNKEQAARARAFAVDIDKVINKRLADEKIKAGPRSNEAAFARRLHIDLIGRIPTLLEISDYIDPTNDNPSKFDDRLDELLESPLFVTNWAHYW